MLRHLGIGLFLLGLSIVALVGAVWFWSDLMEHLREPFVQLGNPDRYIPG